MKAYYKYSLIFSALLLACVSYANPVLSGEYFHINNAHIYAQHYGKGPTVIFESGLGDGVNSWSKVAPVIAEHARVVLYDRAGIDKSIVLKKSHQPHTAQMVVNNLMELLKKLDLSPPYILVGHSLGGLYMQLFAREYPHKVSGVVLIDSVSPHQIVNDPLPGTKADYYLEALGIHASKDEVNHAAAFPNIPLIVLSATIHGKPGGPYNSKELKKNWARLQAKLAAMSNNSQHITANKTKHYIQNEKPWLVIAAINEIMTGRADKS